MHAHDLSPWRHEHVFGQDQVKAGERRTLIVVLITVIAMVIEIAAGIAFGSMALLADGLHMASHAAALGIAFLAYRIARLFAGSALFSFGTGKVNALAGFSGALFLGLFAIGVTLESLTRFVAPVEIAYSQAIIVAVLGLLVNLLCAGILWGGGPDHHHHASDNAQGHADGGADHRGEDHNLRAAFLHVLADAVTSFLAIFALVGGWLLGTGWLDPMMGIVGAALIAKWSIDLTRESGKVLLDWQAPGEIQQRMRDALETDGDRVADLHVWSVGPGIRAAIVSVVSHHHRAVDDYKARLPNDLGIVHLTVEPHLCPGARAA